MRTQQLSWSAAHGWRAPDTDFAAADLVLYFGLRRRSPTARAIASCAAMFAKAHVVGCSTGGQIRNDDVDDDIAAVALRFDRTRLGLACEAVPTPAHSRACGEAIGRALAADDLAGIFVLSDGLNVNGSELVAGVTGVVGAENSADRRACRRQRAVRGNPGRRRLRAAERPRRRGRLLRHGDPDRPRQRRRLGRVRPAPPHHPLERQRAVRTGRRAGARSLRALSRRGRRHAACPARRCCSRC